MHVNHEFVQVYTT